MKKLTWQLVIPLTIISFTFFTKWWYTLPVDAPHTIFYGFPFPFVCDGWHTSLSLQIFMVELIADLLIYFTFWFTVVFIINRYWVTLRMPKLLTVLMTGFAILIAGFFVWAGIFMDNRIKPKRDFTIEVLETGYKFNWQNKPGDSIYYKYSNQHPNN